MRKYGLLTLLASVSLAAFAQDPLSCANGMKPISSVGHSLCATITTSPNNDIGVSMPAGAGSELDNMHVTFGPKIHEAYQAGVKAQKIPLGVAHLIHVIQYSNETYECQKLEVTKDAVLNMTNCIKQTQA